MRRLQAPAGFILILCLAAVLRLARLDQNGFGTAYYAAAVRSMAESWHGFFHAAFDPAGVLAIDKPPLAFWLQVLSVKLLGFNGWSLHLPQAIEGVLSVALLGHLVQRQWGLRAGRGAALILALMPIGVAVDRSNNTDSCLVLMLLLAAWPLLAAAERGSRGLLLLSAALLGAAFMTKMAAALLVVPAFIALYAVTAPVPWPRRVGDLALAAVVLTVVGLAWPLAVELTPAAQRPYVDSTYRNSMLELVLGHNALDRFSRPDWLTVARPALATPSVPAGPFRLLDSLLASQIGWLLPLALGGWLRADRAARLLWGGWLVVCAVVFSAAGGIFLPYYLAVMGPPMAALAALGMTEPAWIVATALWQGLMLWQQPADGTLPLIAVPGAVVAVVAMLVMARRAGSAHWAAAGLLAAPLVWSVAPLLSRSVPTSPVAQVPANAWTLLTAPPPPRPGDGMGNRVRLRRLVERDGSMLATTSLIEAAMMIIRTGHPALALGGYNGVTTVVSQQDLARRVAERTVRYVLLDRRATDDAGSALVGWVRENGRMVEPALWRPPVPNGTDAVSVRRAAYVQGLALYDLRPG